MNCVRSQKRFGFYLISSLTCNALIPASHCPCLVHFILSNNFSSAKHCHLILCTVHKTLCFIFVYVLALTQMTPWTDSCQGVSCHFVKQYLMVGYFCTYFISNFVFSIVFLCKLPLLVVSPLSVSLAPVAGHTYS